MSPTPYLLSRFTSNIPMPTLYAGDAIRKPKLSVIEVLLYNMASMLGGVAAGYDVRLSNVSAVHPILLSDVPALKAPFKLQKQNHNQLSGIGNANNFPLEPQFVANTYHGTAKHNRAALTSLTYVPTAVSTSGSVEHQQTLLKRGDSPLSHYSATPPYFQPQLQPHKTPQHQLVSTISTTSGLGSNFTITNTSGLFSSSLGCSHTQPPTPSPRHRKVSTSTFTENLEFSDRLDTPPPAPAYGAPFRIGCGGAPSLYAPSDYLRNGPNFTHIDSNSGDGAYVSYANRTSYFGSNYFSYRPDINLAYERDCKSYPDYSYDYNNQLPNYYDYVASYEPSQQLQQQQTLSPSSRVSQMGVSAAGHRCTASTISNNSITNQNFNAHEYPDERDLLEFHFDYNNLNLSDYVGEQTHQQHQPPSLYRETILTPPPTKQDLYNSSPKLIKRFRRPTSSLSRMRDYEVHNAVGDSIEVSGSGGLVSYATPVNSQQQLKSQQQQQQFGKPQPMLYTHSNPISPTNTNLQFQKALTAAKAIAEPSSQKVRTTQERPASLPFEHSTIQGFQQFGSKQTRSSLQKYNHKQSIVSTISTSAAAANGITIDGGNAGGSCLSSLQGTPTNLTPPDSLTSDDSSYLSAKEGSISSQHSRVRFSPEAYLDNNATLLATTTTATAKLAATSTIAQCQDLTNQHRRATIAVLNRRISHRHHKTDISSSASPSPSSSS